MDKTEDENRIAKHILLVLSGKGGVGKSTVTCQLAYSLVRKGYKVGVLDVDLCGPSVPKMFNVENAQIHQSDAGWMPVFANAEQTLSVMSIGFLLNQKDEAVVWRGPKKNSMIKQFMNDVVWNDLDYLIIDTPPGTSDEHISVLENVKQIHDTEVSAVLVTTPQALSVNDVRREITFCKKTGIKIDGIIENMSGFVCPNCAECSYLFTRSGGKLLAEKTNCKYLGSIPLDPNLCKSIEEGKNFADSLENSQTIKYIDEITSALIN